MILAMTEDLKILAQDLNSHPDYRVLHRFKPRNQYSEDDAENKRIGIFLDVETTGLDAQVERIIELALLPFEFTSDGRIYRVMEPFDQLEDPQKAISPEISGITGITDEMVKGQHIDDKAVNELVKDAAVVIAHNARFDRPFVEQRWEIFESKAWACSLSQVPWAQFGFESAKLEYLAYRLGFFYDGHRASIDCQVGLDILSRPLGNSNTPTLKTLLDTAREKSYRLWALGAPFEAKDELKARGYRWNNGENGKPKAWHKDFSEADAIKETSDLQQTIMGPDWEPLVETISAFNRFSQRI